MLVISGHGWGHGLGLSQWGAYGYAQHGWTYDQILAHYYTRHDARPDPVATVRVLLASREEADARLDRRRGRSPTPPGRRRSSPPAR